MTKVFLSPSDQHANPASTTPPTSEKAMSRARAVVIASVLKAHGVQTKIGSDNRPDVDEYAARVAESDAWGADLHVADHSDAGGGHYSHTLYFPGSADGRRLATLIEANLDHATPWNLVVPWSAETFTSSMELRP